MTHPKQADERAIGFAEWILQSEYQIHPHKEGVWGKLQFKNGREIESELSSAELYALYLQQSGGKEGEVVEEGDFKKNIVEYRFLADGTYVIQNGAIAFTPPTPKESTHDKGAFPIMGDGKPTCPTCNQSIPAAASEDAEGEKSQIRILQYRDKDGLHDCDFFLSKKTADELTLLSRLNDKPAPKPAEDAEGYKSAFAIRHTLILFRSWKINIALELMNGNTQWSRYIILMP